jgi:hypothetical protein
MLSRKSALKKDQSKTQKIKKRVTINIDKNEGFNDNPEPITPRSKSERWVDPEEANRNRILARKERHQNEAKERNFLRARRNTPFIAAQIARGRFRTESPSSPSGVIELRRGTPIPSLARKNTEDSETWREVNGIKRSTVRRGPIPSIVDSVFRFFGKKGGRKTRKNSRK